MDETKRNNEEANDVEVDARETSPSPEPTDSTPVEAPAVETAAREHGGSTTTEAKTGSSIQNYVIAFVIVAFIIGILGYFLQMEGRIGGNTPTNTNEPATDIDLETADPEGVAVRVNGVTITNQAVLDNIDTLTGQAAQQGVDTSAAGFQTEVQTESIDMLVNTELLLQAANAEGITVSDADVDARIAEIESQLGGPEALTARLNEVGLERSDLRADIADELKISTLIEQQVPVDDIAVTDEEVEAFYNEFGGTEAGLPPLEEVRPQIEAEIIAGEQETLVIAYIETLREEADIEIIGVE